MRASRLILLGVLMAYPVVVIALAASSGILLSQDSVSYLSAARAMGAGSGLISFDGQPLTLFPPGLPLLLGAVEGFGGSAETAAVVLNAACAALIVGGTYGLGYLVLRSTGLSLTAAGVVSLSAPFSYSFVWLWSEPLFTVLVMALLGLLAWAVRSGRSSWWIVIGAGLLVGGAISVRYVGYVLLPVVGLGIWWASRGSVNAATSGRALFRAVVAVALALAAPVVMVVRNLSSGSGPFGDRYPGVRTLQDSLADATGVLGTFVFPPAPVGVAVVIGSLIALLIVVALWSGLMDRDRVVLLLGGFAVLYMGAIVWSQTATRLDPPTARLLTPALPALSVLALVGLRILRDRMRRDAVAWTRASPSAVVRSRGASLAAGAGWTVIGLMALVVMVASIRADMRLVSDAREGRVGLRAAAEASALAAAGVALPDASGFASNDPWRMYLALGEAPVVHLPPSSAEWPIERIDRDLQVLLDAVRAGSVTHALVVDGGGEVLSWSELVGEGIEAMLVAQTVEGDVYRLTSVG